MQNKKLSLPVLLIAFALICSLTLSSCIDTYVRILPSAESTPESAASRESGPQEEESAAVSTDDTESIPALQDTVISFLACPDVIIHTSVFCDAINRACAKKGTAPVYTDLNNAEYDFYPIFEYVRDAVAQADISYVNQETLPGSDTKPIYGYPRFNSPKAIVGTLKDIGYDVVNLAHNHMLDAGDASFAANADRLFTEAGLTAIGYYKNDAALDDIPIVTCKGVRIAFLAYTYGTNGITLPSSSKEVIPYFSEELLRRQIPKAKAQADLVFVSAHWGNENNFALSSQQKEFADLMCELGVDVVIGMHPHIIQPIEWKTASDGHKTLITYSLGNFVSGMYEAKNMLAGMLSFNIVRSAETGAITIEAPVFIPTVTHYIIGEKTISGDTGYRDFKIYYLKDYNDSLASLHGVNSYEESHSPTLAGGKYSYENLLNTLKKYIPAEFLPEEFK